MTYKNYAADIEYSDEDKCFVGHIAGISAIIGFHGDNVAELRSAFEEAVDDYLDYCAEEGKAPEKSYSGKIMFSTSPEIHAKGAMLMEFDGGYQAVIAYDPDIEMFRGEFIGLNGGADFYAADIPSLKKEGRISLNLFLKMCAEDGVPPKKAQGKFALRLPPELYQSAAAKSASAGKSLNAFITEAIEQAVASD